jgi:hypothetical protein
VLSPPTGKEQWPERDCGQQCAERQGHQ